MVQEVFIALTDSAWFDFLRGRADETGRIDEVNFWSPSSTQPLKRLRPGDPVFFRLKRGRDAIAGYGFFAAHVVLRLDDAWTSFVWRNGDPDEERFLQRIGAYRGLDLIADPREPREPLGCTVLRDARLWPRDRWLPWGADQGWAPNIVRGKTETDPNRASRLLNEIVYDSAVVPDDLSTDPFHPEEVDERSIVLARQVQREGQGTFRARLLDAYGRQCAVTGEHTEIVLDAAHIQPYLGPRSNHVQNGLLLTKEFHALFDRGYVTVTPDYRVRVSPRLYDEWGNGHRYRPFDGRELVKLPETSLRPSQEALEWHGEKVFAG